MLCTHLQKSVNVPRNEGKINFFSLDKMCDQISDAILDAHLKQDPDAKVACETVTKTGMIMVCGEITSKVINYYFILSFCHFITDC